MSLFFYVKVGFLYVNCLYTKNMTAEKFIYALPDNWWPSTRLLWLSLQVHTLSQGNNAAHCH